MARVDVLVAGLGLGLQRAAAAVDEVDVGVCADRFVIASSVRTQIHVVAQKINDWLIRVHDTHEILRYRQEAFFRYRCHCIIFHAN